MIAFLTNEKKYILTVLGAEMLLSIIWIYPYALPAKLLLLGWGILLFLKQIHLRTFPRKDIASILLVISCIFSFISCLFNQTSEGLSSFRFFLSNLVLFGVIYPYARSGTKKAQIECIRKYAKYYIGLSLFISLTSLWMLVNKISYAYYPSDNFVSRLFDSLHLMRISEHGYSVGISAWYLDGCVFHCSVLASWGILSIVLSIFVFKFQPKKQKFFLGLNIAVQIVTIIAVGMRGAKLTLMIWGCLVIWFEWKRLKIGTARKSNYLFRLLLVLTMCFLWKITNDAVSGIIEDHFLDKTRNYSQQLAEFFYHNTQEDSKKDAISSKERKIYYEIADDLIAQNRKLYLLNEISNSRIKVWLTGLIKLTDKPLIGFASNNIEVWEDDELQLMGLHNELLTELNMHGIIGTICIMAVWGMALKNILLCLFKGKNQKWIVWASYIIALMISSFLGTLLTFSISFMPVLFWLLMGIVTPYDRNEWIQAVYET